jgi:hypothetical protein
MDIGSGCGLRSLGLMIVAVGVLAFRAMRLTTR